MKIFIAGNSRSGTTMMSRILGNHQDVLAFQELHFFDELLPVTGTGKTGAEAGVKLYATLCAIQRHGYFGSRDYTLFRDEALFTLSGLQLTGMEIFEKFLHNETARNNKVIPCEQTPQSVFSIDEILANYKDARILIMVRDPRAVLLSQKHKWKRRELSGGKIPLREAIRSRINYHPVTISKIWNSVMKKAQRFQNHPTVLFIKYEDLLVDPAKTIKNVCTHCDISYTEAMLDIPVTGSSHAADAAVRGIKSGQEMQWENGGLNKTEIAICQSINGDLMKQYGYVAVPVNSNYVLLGWYALSLPFRLALSLAFNLKRLRNFKKMVRG